MAVGAGDGAVSHAKKLPAKGMEAYIVLQVPHADILRGRKQAKRLRAGT